MIDRELCIMACVFCRDPAFHRWISEELSLIPSYRDTSMIGPGEAGAKQFILMACEIRSRNELDTNPLAATRFHEMIRKPFLAWKEQT